MLEKDIQKTENVSAAERIRNVKTFVPRVDIYENKDSLFLLADMPGVDEKTVDIELEKNVLTITGRVENGQVKDAAMMYSEYEIGDYERVFTLSDQIDRDKIVATVKNGVLRLELPKAEEVKPKKIAIKAA
ncbi:MAG: Spore protein SP21 [Deltaproteobacteria bacterium ADurb.Bin151]|jgi:HSP20 family molecular chaperone IbpA|nr:Hsp20/alpha crystallin family protein [Smithella sp.]OQB49532.1 MAG: Spore protein SP21 [Deltaproteobacteria bacterium ADurb.Bin151]HOU57557.1 Hsp20/alpha crystallin family protein [Smithellaceae bacterium]HQN67900.1 Hsp20/alpha crystallin family protein [Smithellaceae bacterium]